MRIEKVGTMGKRQVKEGMITVRLSNKEIDEIDMLTKGQLSRSQVVRALIRDFLDKSDQDKKEFLFNQLFGE